jgi:hypothetical protein
MGQQLIHTDLELFGECCSLVHVDAHSNLSYRL